MKINLGCGYDKRDGYVNIDIRPEVEPDIIEDVSKLESIKDGSCEVIYASHILEHFSWRDTDKILALWLRKLKRGGLLYIKVPNLMDIITQTYYSTKKWSQLISDIYGGQEYKENYHKTGFEPIDIKSRLENLKTKLTYFQYNSQEITIECEKL